MKLWKPIVLLAGLVLAALPAVAATQYGNAVVEQGRMIVLREGKRLTYNQSAERVPVVEQDLIRVQDNSRVVLRPREGTEVTLGANAVFQVKPWQRHEESGFLSALFGRFRAAVVGLTGGERFNVKTATATIGVKGTEYRSAVQTRGLTLTLGMDSTTFMQLVNSGQIQNVGETAFYLSDGSSFYGSDLQDAYDQMSAAFGDLDAPPPNAPGASGLPGEQVLIELQIIDPTKLSQLKDELAEAGIDGVSIEDVELIEFELDDAKNNLFRGNLDIQYD